MRVTAKKTEKVLNLLNRTKIGEIHHSTESQLCVLDSEHGGVLKLSGEIRNSLSSFNCLPPLQVVSIRPAPLCQRGSGRRIPLLSPRSHLHFGCGSCPGRLRAGNSSGPGAGILAAGRETDSTPEINLQLNR